MKTKFARLLAVVILCIALVCVMYACSPRNPDDFDDPYDDIGTGGDDNVQTDPINTVHKLDRADAIDLIEEAYENSKLANGVVDPASSEWFVIDYTIDYDFEDYLVNPTYVIDYTIILKANIHRKDNSQSELFFEINDNLTNTKVFCVYYVNNTAFFNIGGENEYYIEELNLTTLGGMLANVLIENNIDITAYFIGFLNGKLGIEAADALLPTILNILFTSGSTVTTYENGSKQTISLPLGDINKLLGLLPTFGLNIGWETFGLPNLDPIMRQFLGFGLEDILGREWPLMNISINTHTILGTVNTTSEDGTIVTKEAYLFDGIGINIYTPEIIDKNGNRTPEEYYLNLNVKPMRMGPADKKVDINFANYDLTEEGKQNRYKEAGLANLELDASLFLQSDENGQFTLHDVLGDVVNLGAAGDIPFRFEGTNGGGGTYEFRLNVKTDIDFFDGNKTNLQLNLYYQDQAFIRMYYTEKTLYINMEAFKDANNVQLIPNLKVTGIDITQLLSGNLGVIYPYLDPNYTAPAEGDTPSNVFNEGEEGTEGGTEGGGFDVMGLISFLVGYINLPEGEPRIISLDLDNEAINALLGMFIDFGGKELGLKGIHLSFDQDDIFHTIELGVELSDSVRFGLKLNDVGYFATPVFDNYEMVDSAAERDSYTDSNPLNTRYYSAQFGGNLDLGFEETDGGIDLSGMMSLFLKNVGLGIGVTFTDEMRLGYEVKANLDILQLNQIDIVAIFYYRDAQGNRTDFMMVNYNGGDDALYLNLQDVKKLQDAYPGLNFIGTLPKLKIPNIGLADTLGDINIISLITGIINPGQGGTETQEAAYTFSTPQQLVYDIFSA